MTRKALLYLGLPLSFLLPALAGEQNSRGILPIYIEENHAGSFRGFTRMAELDEPHTLILLDGHSDASAVEHSDEVREGLRRVRTIAEREERITDWRRTGRIQAYSWIEALMPRPIERVIWVPAPKLSPQEKQKLQSEAAEAIDGRTGFEARQAGGLGQRWAVTDMEEFQQLPLDKGPVLATIDLDTFTELPPAEMERQFQLVWERLLNAPDLRGVTFAISRPWLRDDAESYRLLLYALNEVRLLRGARVMFEPFASNGRDDSLKAAQLAREGRTVPAWSIEDAPHDLRTFLAMQGDRYQVSFERERWKALLQQWQAESGPRIETPISVEPVYRVDAASLPDLRVAAGDAALTGRVRWFALRPAAACYNLLPDLQVAKGFTKEAPPWVREKRVLIRETPDGALAAEAWGSYLDQGLGRLCVEAEVETASGWRLTPAIDLRAQTGAGFRRALTEQFGMPYVFGIGFATQDGVDGADTGWGNDCANFLIYAWRRIGRDMAWGNPAQLRARLRTLAEGLKVTDRPAIPEGEIERGLVIDFGNHVAAVWKDVEPLGTLNPEDEVMHHLGGLPEKTTLAHLAETRPVFALRALPAEKLTRVSIGGDIVLRGVEEIGLGGVRKATAGADLVVANLEGIPGMSPATGRRYNFTFRPDRLGWLAQAGVQAVSLANNHAADAGVQAIPGGVELATQHRLGTFGAGKNTESAIRPWVTEKNGIGFAFFGVSCFADAADSLGPGVASLPAHAPEVAQAIGAAESAGQTVIVLIHWGREYSPLLEHEQVRWARWLIDQGADAVAGAHPHVVQPLEYWRGKPIAFSLGNAVYPKALQGADDGAWLNLDINASGKVVSAALHPR